MELPLPAQTNSILIKGDRQELSRGRESLLTRFEALTKLSSALLRCGLLLTQAPCEAEYPCMAKVSAEPRGTFPISRTVQWGRWWQGVQRERRQLFPGVDGKAKDCTVGWVGGSHGC